MDPIVAVILRAALALLFVAAAAHKLRDKDGFRATLDAYGLLPASAIGAAARTLPFVEIGVAILLAAPRAAHAGALLAAGLLALYALAMGVNLLRGRRDLDCGCMGPGARGAKIGVPLLVRNALLIVAALAVLLPVVPRPLVWLDFVTVPLAVLTLAALYAAAENLVALQPTVAALRAEVREVHS